MKTFKFIIKKVGKDLRYVTIKGETYFSAVNILRSIYPIEQGYSSTLLKDEIN